MAKTRKPLVYELPYKSLGCDFYTFICPACGIEQVFYDSPEPHATVNLDGEEVPVHWVRGDGTLTPDYVCQTRIGAECCPFWGPVRLLGAGVWLHELS